MYHSVKDIDIYYESYGSGIPVLMIHGCRPDHRLMKGCMEPVFQSLNSSFQRIYFDLPGMGRTKSAPWITGSDHMLEIVSCFIDGVIPDKRFLLVGESYGGYIARALIKERYSYIDGLLLICPVSEPLYKNAVVPPRHIIESDERLLQTLSESERQQFEYINVIQTREVWKRFKEDILPGLNDSDVDFIDKTFGESCSFRFDVNTLDKPFMKPSLMIMGRQDFIVGYRDTWKIIEDYPRASFVVLDKAGHNMQIEQFHLFNELVEEWLRRVIAEA
ncbi:MAG TPA: alpha/beta hydrolase [Spirochaetota bacterium]